MSPTTPARKRNRLNGENQGAIPAQSEPLDSPTKRKSTQAFANSQVTPNSRNDTLPYVSTPSHMQFTPNPNLSTEKQGKGLRHFSMKVCRKVQEKGVTTYNEVADELVSEEMQSQTATDNSAKNNIRRRCYDALNVLMAMDIIYKQKKEIRWIGLPTNSAQESAHLVEEKALIQERIRQKKAHLHELIIQQIAFKNLVARNTKSETNAGKPEPNKNIQLPYIIINTSSETQIECEMADDGSEYFFKFNGPFEIHDETEVLKRMKLVELTKKEDLEKTEKLVPAPIIPYLKDIKKREGPSS